MFFCFSANCLYSWDGGGVSEVSETPDSLESTWSCCKKLNKSESKRKKQKKVWRCFLQHKQDSRGGCSELKPASIVCPEEMEEVSSLLLKFNSSWTRRFYLSTGGRIRHPHKPTRKESQLSSLPPLPFLPAVSSASGCSLVGVAPGSV